MDDIIDLAVRAVSFVLSNLWLVFVLFIIGASRRNNRNRGARMPLPEPKRAVQTPAASTPSTSLPASFTTVTPPAVINDRPDDLMKDLVKRV